MTPDDHWDKAEEYLADAENHIYAQQWERLVALANVHLRMAYVGSKQGFGDDFNDVR